MNLEGRVLSGYKLITPLGAGAMGTVYKGVHLQTGQEAAVKLISAGNFSSDEYQLLKKRLTDEATAVQKLDSPWIVKVLEVGEDKDSGLHLILELMEGTSLEGFLTTKKKWTGPEFIEKLARPLLMGLANLHDHGVLHRDIKPANLLKALDGSFKISDFGLALFEGRQAKTVTGIVIGTPGYMAPECINKGAEGTTELSDIYSAGATLYYGITGKQAFPGRSIIETVSSQFNPIFNFDILVSGRQNKLQVNQRASDLIMSSMSVDPAMRPQSARNFFEVLLKEINSTEGISAPTKEIPCTEDKTNSSVKISNSRNMTISNDYEGKQPRRKNFREIGPLHNNVKEDRNEAPERGILKDKRKALSFLFFSILLLSVFFYFLKISSTWNILKEDEGTLHKAEFIRAIDEINAIKGPLPVSLMKKTINSGTQWLGNLSKLSGLPPEERLMIVGPVCSKLEDGPFTSLGAFIVARARSESSAATIDNFQYLIQEVRQNNISFANHITAANMSDLADLEKFMLEIQLASVHWTNEFSQFSQEALLAVNDFEFNLEDLVTAIVRGQQDKPPAFGKSIELAAAPYRLHLKLLQSACLADPSGELAMKIQGSSSAVTQKLRLAGEPENKRYRKDLELLDKKAGNLDIANAVVMGVKNVLSIISIDETVKSKLSSNIAIIRDYIEKAETDTEKAVEELGRKVPQSTRFSLELKPNFYEEISVTNRNFLNITEHYFQIIEKGITQYGALAPLKSIYTNNRSPQQIYDVERHAEIRQCCVFIRRIYWYLRPTIINLNCIQSDFTNFEIYNQYYKAEKLQGMLIEGQYSLALFRKIDWIEHDLNQEKLAKRTANDLISYLRHIKTRSLLPLAGKPELEKAMELQADFLNMFSAIQRIIFELHMQADNLSETYLKDYVGIGETFYDNISKRLFPYMGKDLILYKIITNKSRFIPAIHELTKLETEESIKKGSQVIEELSVIYKIANKSKKRTKPSPSEGTKLDVIFAEYLNSFLGRHWRLLRETGDLTQLRKESNLIFKKFLPFALYFSSKERTEPIPVFTINQTPCESRLNVFNLAVINLCHIAIVEKDNELRKLFSYLPMVKETAGKKLKRQMIVESIMDGEPIAPGYD
jgi:serine/threonine protein kinase